MIKKEEAAAPEGDVIAVSVSRMGHDPLPVALPVGSTVAQALAKAGVSTSTRTEYFVSGVRAEMEDELEDGDILTLTTPKQAGSN